MRKARIIIIAALFVFVVFLAVGGWVGSSQAIGSRPEWRTQIAQPADFGLAATVVEFPSRDGIPIKAWWIPAQTEVRGAVILAHGRDGNRSHMLSRAAFLVPSGYHCLAVDLRVHGESGGEFITPGYLEAQDVLGAVDYIRTSNPQTPIIILGHSYGAVAVLHAARETPNLAAVIADSPFLSVSDMMANARRFIWNDPHSSWGAKIGIWLAEAPLLSASTRTIYRLRTGFDFDERKADLLPVIAGLERPPILFLAGERDPIALPENTRRMYDAVRSPQKVFALLPNAGHNTYRAAPREYKTAVLSFLGKVFAESGKRD